MSDWEDKIEAQIEFLRQDMMYHEAADDMQALLDVAKAAEEFDKVIYGYSSKWAAVMSALDKLKGGEW